MTTEDKVRENDADFYRGFAAAVATLIRSFDQPGMASDIMTSNGVTVKDLRDAKVDQFDLKPITEAMR